MDLSGYDDDRRFPDAVVQKMIADNNPRYSHMFRDGLTLRQMYEKYAGARGQQTVVGTPEQIADLMQEWFLGYAVDGFLIQPAYLPGGLDDFVGQVVPELQQRGLFREEYEGTTLRENLGLVRPKKPL